MLTCCQSFSQKLNMRIMRRRDIDDIHRRIRTDLFKTCKYILHTVFLRKSDCFLLRTVHNTIQLLSSFFHCLCQFIGNDTAACTHPVYDLANIHTTAYCPAHCAGDRYVSLPIFFHEIGFYSLYHGLYLGFHRILDNHNKLIPAHTINLASVRRQFIQYGG